jgi:glutamate-1-semialdehyde 2,1-aminomutase
MRAQSFARRGVSGVLRRWKQHRAARRYRAAVVDHALPSRLHAGEIVGARVEVRNTGSSAWSAHDAGGPQLHVNLDDALLAAIPLPRPVVGPGECVTFHLALAAPETPGSYRLHFTLAAPAIPHVTPLPDIARVLDVTAPPDTDAARAFATMIRHNLWHYLPTSGIARSRQGHPYPQFISRAKGAHVWDPEGHRFIDFTMGWGATILGHADDRIQRAIANVLESAPLTPFPDPIEMDVTRMLVEDFGGEMVLFGKNGSDVCTIAARLARLATGRRQILSCGFHGWQDFSLGHLAFDDTGVVEAAAPAFHKFRFNDTASFSALFEQHRKDLAAVMIEPAGPHADDETGLHGEPDPDFLRHIAAAARDAGALMIYDEIITGYRYPGGSVQKAIGETPDLTCLGKAVASGMPLAALVGRTRRFHDLIARTRYCPTFKAEVYSLAAAKAAMAIYRTEPVAAHIAAIGAHMKQEIDRVCAASGLAASCRGPAFRFQLTFSDPDSYRRRLKRTLYFQRLLEDGIITVTGVMLPSYAHTRAIADETLAAIRRIIPAIADAERTGTLERAIDIPLL